MKLKYYKPVTAGQRHKIGVINKEIKKDNSIKTKNKFLKIMLKKKAGRNNSGKITVRHRGGKSQKKRFIRIVDYSRDISLYNSSQVLNIEYNGYNRTYLAKMAPLKSKFSLYNEAKYNEWLKKELKILRNKILNKKLFYIIAPKELKKNMILRGNLENRINNRESIQNLKNTMYYMYNIYYNKILKNKNLLYSDMEHILKDILYLKYIYLTPNSFYIYKENLDLLDKKKDRNRLEFGEAYKLKELPIGSEISNIQVKERASKLSNTQPLKKEIFHQNKQNLKKKDSIEFYEMNPHLRYLMDTNREYNNYDTKRYHGKYSRSPGTFSIILKTIRDNTINNYRTIVRLPSKQLLSLSSNCIATLGQNSNELHNKKIKGKAGVNRWLGKRPKVSGEARNPVDHPHGGKSHGSGGLGNPPKNYYGKLAKWQPK